MNILFNYALSSTNYGWLNKNNFFNFVIDLFENAEPSQRKKIITKLKIFVGNSFCSDLKKYILLKDNTNPIIAFL